MSITPTELLNKLGQPAAYPFAVDAVDVHHTHISMVFLAGDFAYKIKKPVQLGFLDFSTLERRRHFCEEEVRLNRRLAPAVYLGVVPVTRQGASLRFEGAGPVVEWAVKMRRLPPEATLESRLAGDGPAPFPLDTLAAKLARFHAASATGADVAALGRFDVVAGNMRENFVQTQGHVGVTVDAVVYERVRALTEAALIAKRSLIEARAARGVPRDTHGDLHLDHVYWFPDRPPPDDWVIIDCIEFNERFRYADPVSDVAFLAMDLTFHGRRDLAKTFAEAYQGASGDREGAALLPLYIAYRAVIRAKVEGIELAEKEIPADERRAACLRAQAHWLLALGELEAPGRRPALLLVAGLPGAGKSTLARALAEADRFELLRSDLVRKELAGLAPTESGRAGFGSGIYGAEWTERTYRELEGRAAALLAQGKRVLVDASFRSDRRRRNFSDLARRLAIPALMLECRADPAVVRKRLAERRGDASDADWAIYELAAGEWELPSPVVKRSCRVIDTTAELAEAMRQARLWVEEFDRCGCLTKL